MKNFHKLRTLSAALGMALALPAGAVDYTYDDLNRLISAHYTSGKRFTYRYDPAGNLLKVEVETVATGPTQVQLSGPDGTPLANTAVTIDGVTYVTDENGYITLDNLSGEHTVEVDGYAPLNVDFSGGSVQVSLEEAGCTDQADDPSEDGTKVAVCHIPGGDMSKAHTLWVGAPAVQAHLKHGDLEGVCPGDEAPPAGCTDNDDEGADDDQDDADDTEESDDGQDDETTTGPLYPCVKLTPAQARNKHCATAGQNVTAAFPGVSFGPGSKPNFKVVDFNAEIAPGATTLAEDTEEVLNVPGAAQSFAVEQDPATGNMEVTPEGTEVEFVAAPTEVIQAAANEEPGVTTGDSGEVIIITADSLKLVLHPALQAPAAMIAALRNIGVLPENASPAAAFLESVGLYADTMTLNADGTLAVYPGMHQLTGKKYLAKPGLMTMPAPEGAEENTLLPADSELLPAGNGNLLQLCFKNKAGKLKVQTLYPAAADVAALVDMKHVGVKVDAAGPGTLSFKANWKTQIVLFDYEVTQDELPASGGLEFHAIDDANEDGVDDYQVIYANGDTQKAFVIDSQ